MPDPQLDQEHAPTQARQHLCGPAYSGFSGQYHVVPGRIEPRTGELIHIGVIGVDFGLTSAGVFGPDVRGQVRIINELVTRDTDSGQFVMLLAKPIREKYEEFQVRFTGDPRGDDRQPNQVVAKTRPSAPPCPISAPFPAEPRRVIPA